VTKIRPSCGYRSTASFQTATLIYDATYWFCEKYLNSYTRMTDPTDQIPSCPLCGKTMVLRTAKNGKNISSRFWGCSSYPDCKVVVKL
jgi:predicted RNA-binding Zn-ribbon protein involved in translation (DUF1610 family)